MQAKSGDTVQIHYTGKLTDGTQFDSSAGRSPLEFQLGSGMIIRGLDREVTGMEVGDKKTVKIAAEDAYGPHREEAVQEVPRSQIPDTIELAEGVELQATTPGGDAMRLRVTGLTDDTVTLDANHPLAGQDLVFDLELVAIAS